MRQINGAYPDPKVSILLQGEYDMIKAYIWRCCCFCSILLSIVAFTPLVIPSEVSEPFVLGMPRTLWAGLLVSLGLMIITIVGAWAADASEKGGGK